MPEHFGMPNFKIEKPEEQQKEKQESQKFDLEFYITDHSADNADTGNPEKLRELYGDVKKDGVESV